MHLHLLSIIPLYKCLDQQLLNGLASYFNLVYVVIKWGGHQGVGVGDEAEEKKKKQVICGGKFKWISVWG